CPDGKSALRRNASQPRRTRAASAIFIAISCDYMTSPTLVERASACLESARSPACLLKTGELDAPLQPPLLDLRLPPPPPLLLPSPAVASCSAAPAPTPDDPVGENQSSIVYGTNDTAHTAVVALLGPVQGGYTECSGTIVQVCNGVASVLTAAHCCDQGAPSIV